MLALDFKAECPLAGLVSDTEGESTLQKASVFGQGSWMLHRWDLLLPPEKKNQQASKPLARSCRCALLRAARNFSWRASRNVSSAILTTSRPGHAVTLGAPRSIPRAISADRSIRGPYRAV